MTTDREVASKIRCILTDVDGVLTDGRIVYDNSLIESKRFHVHDGVGIKAWMSSGFGFGILTARNSRLVEHRADELGVTSLRQGFEQKLPAAEEMLAELGYGWDELCYIGDDLPDLPVMRKATLAVAPADASRDAMETADWVLNSNGGGGALRELTERLLRAKSRWEEHVPV
ncbi:MAG: HAD hydrolase family protein [Planctomycetota bacterium]